MIVMSVHSGYCKAMNLPTACLLPSDPRKVLYSVDFRGIFSGRNWNKEPHGTHIEPLFQRDTCGTQRELRGDHPLSALQAESQRNREGLSGAIAS